MQVAYVSSQISNYRHRKKERTLTQERKTEGESTTNPQKAKDCSSTREKRKGMDTALSTSEGTNPVDTFTLDLWPPNRENKFLWLKLP